MKKNATNRRKLQLHRETLRALAEADLDAIQGGTGTIGSGLYSCKPCNTAGATCLCLAEGDRAGRDMCRPKG